MKKRWKQYGSSIAFLDLLFNILLAFVAFFMCAFLLVNPKVKQEKNVEAKAEMIITVTWPRECEDDVDTYVEEPTGKLVYFQRKEDGLMHLDRDDLGHANDKIITPSGTYEYNENREMVTLRGLIPGEYTVNVHMYSKRGKKPVEVTIILEKINPSLKLCASKTVTLTKNGDERTAFRFTIKDGDVTEIIHLPKKLCKIKRIPDYNEGQNYYNEEPNGE